MKIYIKILLLFLIVSYPSLLFAQVLQTDEMEKITLADGLEVTLARKVSGFDEIGEAYYYLPVNLEFSSSKGGDAEFSFLVYREQQEITGGILHFLVRWGLHYTQLKEADSLLKISRGDQTVLMGAVMPEGEFPQQTLQIAGDTELAQLLQNSEATLGKVALLPNTKMAASFHLDKAQAIRFKELFKDPYQLKNTHVALELQLRFKEPQVSGVHLTPFILKSNFKTLLNQ